jgi:hypothetical protein
MVWSRYITLQIQEKRAFSAKERLSAGVLPFPARNDLETPTQEWQFWIPARVLQAINGRSSGCGLVFRPGAALH